MPTYEYFCGSCGYEFEMLQSISTEPERICPRCGQLTVKRKISGGSGLIFKGSGFYITDYAKKNISVKNEQKSEKPAAKTATESKMQKTSDPKPETSRTTVDKN